MLANSIRSLVRHSFGGAIEWVYPCEMVPPVRSFGFFGSAGLNGSYQFCYRSVTVLVPHVLRKSTAPPERAIEWGVKVGISQGCSIRSTRIRLAPNERLNGKRPISGLFSSRKRPACVVQEAP